MKNKAIITTAAGAILTVLIFIGCNEISASDNGTDKKPESSEKAGSETRMETSDKFSYESYASVLSTYVNASGMVDYKDLKENRAQLDRFVALMAGLDSSVYDSWSDDAKIAFWTNAYNALTLKAIINHYPIEASLVGSVLYPDNSIRQIDGVWTNPNHVVMGKKRSLDWIEHKKLRPGFNEPRIHMALVCAAMGCPPLRTEPYYGEKLDKELDDQTRAFIKDPDKFRIDREEGVVYLSSIFKWFGQDFKKTYGTEEFEGHSKKERAVLNFLSGYLSDEDAEYLKTGDYDIDYLDYDWSLNEQK